MSFINCSPLMIDFSISLIGITSDIMNRQVIDGLTYPSFKERKKALIAEF